MNSVRFNDAGTAFRLTVGDGFSEFISISGASSLGMRFRRPDGSVFDRTARLVTDGFDGQTEYVTVSGDLNMVGHWHVQVIVGLGESLYRSTVIPFVVQPNL